MKKIIVAFLVVLLSPATFNLSNALAQEQAHQEHVENGKAYIHVDFERLLASENGKIIADSIFQIPFIREQFAAIPEELEFLRQAKPKSLTLLADEQKQDGEPILELVAEIDSARLLNMLSHANGYVRVKHNEITIHHWISDFEKIGDQFMGQVANSDSEAESDSDPVYLAMPKENHFLVSTSLALLVEQLETVQSIQRPAELQSIKIPGNRAALIQYSLTGDMVEVPGNIAAVVYEGGDGMLTLHTELLARNEIDRQAAQMIVGVLKNPELVSSFQVGASLGSTSEPQPEVDRASLFKQKSISMSEKAKTTKATTPEHNNEIQVGFRINSTNAKNIDIDAMMETILRDCVEYEHNGDLLTLKASAYLGPCRVIQVAKDSAEAKKRGQQVNSMQFIFQVYTTEKDRQAAERLTESTDPTKLKK